jgi:AAA family ATP:ADP antiporter
VNGSLVNRLFKVEPGEARVLAVSAAYFFLLLAAGYLLRPLREELAVQSGVRSLKWLYLATGGSMLAVSTAFAALVARLPRGRFIAWAYQSVAGGLLVFYALLVALPESRHTAVGRAFFVWVSVFNVFMTSVFWSFMADVFTNAQARRLFPAIAVGGTLGQVCGSFAAGRLTRGPDPADPSVLILCAVGAIEAACLCVLLVGRMRPAAAPGAPEAPVGGGPLAGLKQVAASGYLRGIALLIVCYTITSTFLYATKIEVGAARSAESAERVAFFAGIDLWAGIATVGAQLFLTSRLVERLGVGAALAVLPLVTMAGFALLGAAIRRPEWLSAPLLLVAFEATRRASNFAFSHPAREMLFTVVGREDKYKAKNVIDTFVYRTGDQAGIWAWDGLLALGLGAGGACFAAAGISAAWTILGLHLGLMQRRLAAGRPRPP